MDSSLFQVAGLPLHPLVVHAVVVLLPLAALGIIAEVLVPALRRRFAGLTVLGLAAGTAAAFVAKESGEALAKTEGLPVQHSSLGNMLPPVAAALLLVAVVWWFLQRRAPRSATPGPDAPRAGQSATTVAGLIAAVLAVAVTVLTVLVGHSGATAVWNPDAAGATPVASATPTAAPASTTPAASTSPIASATPTPTATPLTMAAVREHATASACWAVVDGDVYDLTSWIARHPGGQQRILNLCGTDATAQFMAQHASTALARETLAGFRLGPLAA